MRFRSFLIAAAVLAAIRVGPASAEGLAAAPAQVVLDGPGAAQQLVAWESRPGTDVTVDRTATAHFRSLAPHVVRVSPAGLVTPVADGAARVQVSSGSRNCEVRVTVRHARKALPFSFPNGIAPILSREGCNAGTCHGKAEGQHGFKLSVFGYDLPADYQAITRAAGGRRIARMEPGRSLILLKATAQLPHGGGLRFPPNSAHYAALATWIASGSPYGPADAPTLTAVEVFPRERALLPRGDQQLIVTAHYSDGSSRDVTREARYGSNSEPIASVDDAG